MDEHEKNQNHTPNSMDECKENQDLIFVMHKKALNETLLAIIEKIEIKNLKIMFQFFFNKQMSNFFYT
jgi:hypothetical protein